MQCAALLMIPAAFARPAIQSPAAQRKSPIVIAVGCAREGPHPAVWILSRVGERLETTRPGITSDETTRLSNWALGTRSYELIGVADFVDVAASRKIGVRGEILAASRVNATGVLTAGRKIAVKGLLIEGAPPRINLTSVVSLDRQCP